MSFFLDPAWLWGMGALALPVAIHLFFRRRFQVRRWAAMRFLTQAIEKSSRRRRLTQVLLMAARMLILALLAAAFARPYLSSASGAAAAMAPRRYCLVLDRSLSMAYREGGESCWDLARGRAAAWIRTLSGADKLLVVVTPPAGTAQALSFTGDMEQAAAQVGGLTLSDGPADFLAALTSGWQAAQAAALPDLHYVVVTDLQRLSFREDAKAGWAEFARKAGDGATLSIVDVGPAQPADVGIARLDLPEGLAGAGQPVRLRATVRRSGGRAVDPVPVTFWVDGVKKESRLVDPAPGATAHCEAAVVFETPGHHVVAATLPDDALREDNRAEAVAVVRSSVRVACVHDPGTLSDLGRSTSLLEFALAPAPGLSPFEPEPVTLEELPGRAADADAFLVADVAGLPARAVEALEGAVRRGRGAAFFPGDHADAASWRSLYGEGDGLLPARIERIEEAGTAAPFRLVEGAAGGAFIEPFSPVRGDLSRVAVWKRWSLAGDAAFRRTVLAWEDGQPALVERSFGRGTTVLWTGGLDSSWTNLAARPAFVPWVHQLARMLVGRQTERVNRAWGESSRWELPVESVGKRAELVSPEGLRQAPAPVQEEGGWELPLGPFDRAGLWSLRIEGEPDVPIAAGLPEAELDLSRIGEDEISALAGGIPVSFGRSWEGSEAAASGAELSRLFLFALLALFYAESWLAWRAGHGARGAAA